MAPRTGRGKGHKSKGERKKKEGKGEKHHFSFLFFFFFSENVPLKSCFNFHMILVEKLSIYFKDFFLFIKISASLVHVFLIFLLLLS